MVRRREFIIAGLAAGALARPGLALAAAITEASPVGFEMPAGACDCHAHIHGDPADYPWFPDRVYTPETAFPDEMRAIHEALGIERVVIVTPSVYGTDNSATLWGMKARGGSARGIAVIDAATPDAELAMMDAAGMRGARLNLATTGVKDPEVARRMVAETIARIAPLGWHLQINASPAAIAAMKAQLADAPIPIVIDHFGGAAPEKGVEQPGFADLVELVASGPAYVKVSINGGPRESYAGFAPLAEALIAANPDRILWGSNWPHPNNNSGRAATEVSPLWQVDGGTVLSQLAIWAPDAETRRRILVDNPARLYQF